jgi:hypothetical protein
VSEGEGNKARLKITAVGYLDLDGRILESVPAKGKPPPPLLRLPPGGKLFAWFQRRPGKLAKGPSKIPIAVCDPIGPDGVIEHRRSLATHPWSFRILELKVEHKGGALAFGDIEQHGAPPTLSSAEVDRALRELTDAARDSGGEA